MRRTTSLALLAGLSAALGLEHHHAHPGFFDPAALLAPDRRADADDRAATDVFDRHRRASALLASAAASLAATMSATAAAAPATLFNPVDYGADPTGATVSSDSLDACAAAMLALGARTDPEGHVDLGGATLDLGGGIYLVRAGRPRGGGAVAAVSSRPILNQSHTISRVARLASCSRPLPPRRSIGRSRSRAVTPTTACQAARCSPTLPSRRPAAASFSPSAPMRAAPTSTARTRARRSARATSTSHTSHSTARASRTARCSSTRSPRPRDATRDTRRRDATRDTRRDARHATTRRDATRRTASTRVQIARISSPVARQDSPRRRGVRRRRRGS